MEKSNSQYDSFLFWRQPIPALDLSELEDLGLIDGKTFNTRTETLGRQEVRRRVFMFAASLQQGELPEFSSFNYWRAPIADVDALLEDLNLLL
ncbi:protein AF1q isoform X1 [Parambassis ranga]|uniref:Protein AF1q n=1 Tax=Parambassis ranga TaxID=210632 RepID=A0A6P7K455_9TELE|nr:protein AF1q isoform X1 [Parambassis ranga]